ncbi:carbamoyltransferase C-terminal domain-containing protein [Marinomonas transparens]|uniref:Decarbamoylnovobiocin carbamoyltransferase n=1 Tax=Marinomonas transparens TaxID=2795388 RepID=A0A934JLT5_9GAMM|nr:carbamoyltransferase C-terminal domain-containing protein [Marinomonas transparens]MBJ7536728.1 hypothetical protein [Marinomonas transparens]
MNAGTQCAFQNLEAKKTVILGINNNEDASAVLLVGGKLVAAVQEERFSRNKLKKCWPIESINYVLNHAGVTLNEVDIVAYGVAGEFSTYDIFPRYAARIRTENDAVAIESICRRIEEEVLIDSDTSAEFISFIDKYGLTGKVFRMSHHESHGVGAYAFSPFKDSLVLTSDGRGDFESLCIYKVLNGKVDKIHSELTIDSIGYFYSIITVLLGYSPYRHEGKVTGLAAHGDPKVCISLMKKMIDVIDGRVKSQCGKFYNPSMNSLNELSSELINEASQYSPEDIAAAAQAHLENMVCSVLQQYLDPDLPTNVCLSGGTFGNVLLNQKIFQMDGVDSVYVVPFMGDGGQSACSAGAAYFSLFNEKPAYESLFLGPWANEAESLSYVLESLPLSIYCQKVSTPALEIVKLLKKDNVVAIVKGRMEFGPRSLCNRSIIYHAVDPTVNDWLNERLNRTEFMPFAPVTAFSLAPKCYLNWSANNLNSYNMTMTFDCTEFMQSQCPAAVHIDGTARPQIISANGDSLMFELLTEWFKETGQPSLINTSYNRHEEPIVCNIREALSPLVDGVVDAVLLNEEYLLTRTEKIL